MRLLSLSFTVNTEHYAARTSAFDHKAGLTDNIHHHQCILKVTVVQCNSWLMESLKGKYGFLKGEIGGGFA